MNLTPFFLFPDPKSVFVSSHSTDIFKAAAAAAAAITQNKILMAASQQAADSVHPFGLNLSIGSASRKDKMHVQGSFKCPDCGKMYGLKRNLLRHSKFECNKEPQFQCPFCPQRFKQKCHVFRHATRLHPDCPLNILGFGGPKIKLPI